MSSVILSALLTLVTCIGYTMNIVKGTELFLVVLSLAPVALYAKNNTTVMNLYLTTWIASFVARILLITQVVLKSLPTGKSMSDYSDIIHRYNGVIMTGTIILLMWVVCGYSIIKYAKDIKKVPAYGILRNYIHGSKYNKLVGFSEFTNVCLLCIVKSAYNLNDMFVNFLINLICLFAAKVVHDLTCTSLYKSKAEEFLKIYKKEFEEHLAEKEDIEDIENIEDIEDIEVNDTGDVSVENNVEECD